MPNVRFDGGPLDANVVYMDGLCSSLDVGMQYANPPTDGEAYTVFSYKLMRIDNGDLVYVPEEE